MFCTLTLPISSVKVNVMYGKEMSLIVSILNILTLLKEEPKGFQQLYDSGCFYGWRHLHETVRTCLNAGLIEREYIGREELHVKEVMSHTLHKRLWHKAFNLFYLTSMGVDFLSFYGEYQVRKVKVLTSKEGTTITFQAFEK